MPADRIFLSHRQTAAIAGAGLAAALVFAADGRGDFPAEYTIEPLLPPGAPHSVSARGLYDDGTLGIEVSKGDSNSVGDVEAWVRFPDGTWLEADIPAGNNQINQLGAIGPDGTMYGTWRVDNNIFDQRAFKFTPDGTFTDIGRLPNAAGSPSNTFFNTATAEYAACRTANVGYVYRTSDSEIIELPTIQSTGLATAFGSNADNRLVGISPSPDGSRATLWRKDGNDEFEAINMGLPADPIPDATSTARGVNNLDVAVGYTGTFTENDAFIWNEDDGMEVLPRIESQFSHFAYDISDEGVAVGYRAISTSNIGAVIWDSTTGDGYDLQPLVQNDEGWHLLDAQYINAGGQIMGRGILHGLHTVYLLTPVDEAIPGDLTGDGTVGGADLGILLSEWGPCDDCDDCPADLTGNCNVGGADLGVLLSNWTN